MVERGGQGRVSTVPLSNAQAVGHVGAGTTKWTSGSTSWNIVDDVDPAPYFILAFTLDPQAERGPRVLLPHSPLGILTVNLLALFHRIGVYLK
jgi:hypothetical protein